MLKHCGDLGTGKKGCCVHARVLQLTCARVWGQDLLPEDGNCALILLCVSSWEKRCVHINTQRESYSGHSIPTRGANRALHSSTSFFIIFTSSCRCFDNTVDNHFAQFKLNLILLRGLTDVLLSVLRKTNHEL